MTLRRPVRAVVAMLFAVVACREAVDAIPEVETTASPSAKVEFQQRLLGETVATRDPRDGGGRAWLEIPEASADGPPRLPAASRQRFRIVYEVGPEGIARGGAITLVIPSHGEWSAPKRFTPAAPGYTQIETEPGFMGLDVSIEKRRLQLVADRRPLEPGERIRIEYGAGDRGAKVGRYAAKRERLWLSVDGDGNGFGSLVADSPEVEIVPSRPRRLAVTVPSVVRPGERIRITLAALDRWANAAEGVTGDVEFVDAPEGLDLPAAARLELGDRGRTRVTGVARLPGVYRLRVRVGSIEGWSNPLVASEEARRVLWGDLHGHSALSDGIGSAEDYFSYARDVAALDVVALTDHDHHGAVYLDQTPENWAEIVRQTNRFHEPGRFVTLHGYEWTNWLHGHRHVLYFQGDGRILSSIDPDTDTPRKLWRALEGQQALTFAHHSAGGPVATNWEIPPDPHFEPVTEIVSLWGSSEALDAPKPILSPVPGNFVRDVLDRGYRLGFVGSGDTHENHPGKTHALGHSGGLAAFVDAELSRKGLLSALRARRVYATNGPRIVLDAWLGEHDLGATFAAPGPGSTTELRVSVVAENPLERVDVVRSGRIAETIAARGVRELELSRPLADLRSGEYVYVRVVQEDEGAAWTSPFFLD